MNDSIEKILKRLNLDSGDAIRNKNSEVYGENIELLIEIFKKSVENSSNKEKSVILQKLKDNIFGLIRVLLESRENVKIEIYFVSVLEELNRLNSMEYVIGDSIDCIEIMIDLNEMDLARSILFKVFELNNGREILDKTTIDAVITKYIRRIEDMNTVKEINDIQVDMLLRCVHKNIKLKEVAEGYSRINHNIYGLYMEYIYAILKNENIKHGKQRYLEKTIKYIIRDIRYSNDKILQNELTRVICEIIRLNINTKKPLDSKSDDGIKSVQILESTIKEITDIYSNKSSEEFDKIILLVTYIYLHYLAYEEENIPQKESEIYRKLISDIKTSNGMSIPKCIYFYINDIWRYYKQVSEVLRDWDRIEVGKAKWIILPSVTFEMFLNMSAIKSELNIDKINEKFGDVIENGMIYKYLNEHYEEHFKESYVEKLKKISSEMNTYEDVGKTIQCLEKEVVEFWKRKEMRRDYISEERLSDLGNSISDIVFDEVHNEISLKKSNLNYDKKKIQLQTIHVDSEFFSEEKQDWNFIKNEYIRAIYIKISKMIWEKSIKKELAEYMDRRLNKDMYENMIKYLQEYKNIDSYIGMKIEDINGHIFATKERVKYNERLINNIESEYLYYSLTYFDSKKIYLDIADIKINIGCLSEEDVDRRVNKYKKEKAYMIDMGNNLKIPFDYEEAYEYIKSKYLKITAYLDLDINIEDEVGIAFKVK